MSFLYGAPFKQIQVVVNSATGCRLSASCRATAQIVCWPVLYKACAASARKLYKTWAMGFSLRKWADKVLWKNAEVIPERKGCRS
jgi:hypothetical protein